MAAPRAWVREDPRTKGNHPRDKRWQVKYTDPLTRRQRTKGGFDTKHEAQSWADDFTANARQGTYIDPSQGSVTFNVLANEWHANKVWHRARTRDDTAKIINGPKSPTNLAFGAVQLADMTHEAIAEYIATLSTTRAPQTVRNHYYTLRQVLDYATRTRRILSNPADGITLPKQRKQHELEADRYPLTQQEIAAIVANISAPYDMYVRLLAATGMRPEEAAALTLRNVDTQAGTVDIRAVVVEASGRLIREEYTKTSHSRRTITFDTNTLRHLATYLQDHQHRALAWFTANPEHTNPGDALPLFVGWGDGRGGNAQTRTPLAERLDYSTTIRPSAFTKQLWHKAREQANVPDGVTPYSLRHAHASLLVDRIGQPGALTLKEVQDRLGHSSAVMTLDRYAHRSRTDHDKARRSLDDALAPEPTAPNVTRLRRRDA